MKGQAGAQACPLSLGLKAKRVLTRVMEDRAEEEHCHAGTGLRWAHALPRS